MKAAIVILLICTLGLGGALMWRHNQAGKQAKADEVVKITLTNTITDLQTKVVEQEGANKVLEGQLLEKNKEITTVSNKLIETVAALANTEQKMQSEAAAAKANLAKQDERIAKLDGEKEQLEKKASDLQSAISSLEQTIADTEKKLAASEGDREFLLKELKRLQLEKADLEKQFNDLSVLRNQIAKLKEELSVAKRLEWIRTGIYGQSAQRGAEKLQQAAASMGTGSKFPLNVELKQDGTTRVISGGVTNAPANPAQPR